MTDQEKFNLCLQAAGKIIGHYRAQAPKGFDPQMSWVALAVGVGTAVYSGVSANQQKKKAQGQAAQAAKNNQLPVYDPPDMPNFIPLDIQEMLKMSVTGDTDAYRRSDEDFARRHKKTVQAEKIFEDMVLQDQRGEHELTPQLQNEFMRAGLSGALESLGDSPGVLTPGSAGEANVARNLGLNILGFQDRNRNNRMESLRMAEEIFPRRQIGMGGGDLASALMSNVEGENNFNQANYEAEVGAYNNNYNVNSQNQATRQTAANSAAQAEAQADAAQTQALTQALAGMAKAYGTSQAGTATMPNAASAGTVKGYTYYPSVGYRKN